MKPTQAVSLIKSDAIAKKILIAMHLPADASEASPCAFAASAA